MTTTNTTYLTEAAEIVARTTDAMKLPESVADFEMAVARAGLHVQNADRLHGDLLDAHRLAIEGGMSDADIDDLEEQIAAATKAGNRAQIAHDAACRGLAGAAKAEQVKERERRTDAFKRADIAVRAGLRKLEKAGQAYLEIYNEVKAQKLDSAFFESMVVAKQIGCQLQSEPLPILSAEPVRVSREVLHYQAALSNHQSRINVAM